MPLPWGRVCSLLIVKLLGLGKNTGLRMVTFLPRGESGLSECCEHFFHDSLKKKHLRCVPVDEQIRKM